jgi:hypothetical protein
MKGQSNANQTYEVQSSINRGGRVFHIHNRRCPDPSRKTFIVQIVYLIEVNPELRALALKSRKFREWQPTRYFATSVHLLAGPKPDDHDAALATEPHYTPKELADTWGLAPDTIRELFESEPGVMIVGSNGTRTKRRYRTFRIPESVAVRVHGRLSAKP